MKNKRLSKLFSEIIENVYWASAGLDHYARCLDDTSYCGNPIWEIKKLIDDYVEEEHLELDRFYYTEAMAELEWEDFMVRDVFYDEIKRERIDVVDKIENLYGSEISEYVYNKIKSNFKYYETYIIDCIIDNLEEYEDQIKYCMQELYEQYEEDEIKEMQLDIYDAIYNCDEMWLEIIADEFDIDAEDLADYNGEDEEDEEEKEVI